MRNKVISISKLGIIGMLAGGFIGFLLRPSSALAGKLPFLPCLTRGATLEGVDQVMIHLAEKSFDIMLIGAIIGLAAGIILAYLIKE